MIEKFDHAALIIEETKDLSSLEIDNLIGSLTSHEERIMKRTKVGASNNDNQAFSIKENEGQGRGTRGRGKIERGGRRGSFGRGRGREQNSKNEPASSSRGDTPEEEPIEVKAREICNVFIAINLAILSMNEKQNKQMKGR